MNNLRSIRKRKNKTLSWLSEKSGVSIASLSQIETGQTLPSIQRAYVIANALNVSVLRVWPNRSK